MRISTVSSGFTTTQALTSGGVPWAAAVVGKPKTKAPAAAALPMNSRRESWALMPGSASGG